MLQKFTNFESNYTVTSNGMQCSTVFCKFEYFFTATKHVQMLNSWINELQLQDLRLKCSNESCKISKQYLVVMIKFYA